MRGPQADDPAASALVWFAVFILVQVLALSVVLALDPAGFDPCGTEGAGPRGVQRAIAGAALVLSAIDALRRVRGWHRLPAVACLVLAAFVYWVLLGDASASSC